MESDAPLWIQLFRKIAHQLTALAWARRLAAGGTRTFMHEPGVRRRINRRISGNPDLWPMDHFAAKFAGRRFERGLSLGCGEGALERDVLSRGWCQSMVGIDLSAELVELAGRKAAEQGLQGASYRQGDLDSLELPAEAFDIVFVHQALHHVENLDFCLDQARRALVPGGIFYVDEYVGPSRTDWTEARLQPLRDIYHSLSPQARRARRLREPVDRLDPSEAIRSAEILPTLQKYFSILERRDYGGQILAVIYPNLRHDRLSAKAWESLLEELLDAEDELARAGALPYYSWLVAEPRSLG